MIILLNRIDLAEKENIVIDTEHLSKHLGCPVLSISAIKNSDIKKVKSFINNEFNNQLSSDIKIEYPDEIEDLIKKWTQCVKEVSKELGC